MFGAILKATNSSFKKGMTFSRSIYVKKVMKLLAFTFEQPSYSLSLCMRATKAMASLCRCAEVSEPFAAQNYNTYHSLICWLISLSEIARYK